MSGRSHLLERLRTRSAWRDGDLVWLGLLLSLLSAVLMIALLWWLLS